MGILDGSPRADNEITKNQLYTLPSKCHGFVPQWPARFICTAPQPSAEQSRDESGNNGPDDDGEPGGKQAGKKAKRGPATTRLTIRKWKSLTPNYTASLVCLVS